MSAKPQILIYGHSFPARLNRKVMDTGESLDSVLNLTPDQFNVRTIGHPGLTFFRIFSNAEHYIEEVRSYPLDLLILDLGTNDLCNQDGTPETVVENTVKFLDQVCSGANRPQQLRIVSVIQRSRINRVGQVSVSTFNHRAKRYNCQLGRKLESMFSPNVQMYSQRRINRPKYLSDGCHLNVEGVEKYCRGLKEIILSSTKTLDFSHPHCV